VSDVLKKYQAEDPEVQQIAKEAYQDYVDTASQRNKTAAAEFIRTWGKDPAKFVDAMVQGEKEMPGYRDTIFANRQ